MNCTVMSHNSKRIHDSSEEISLQFVAAKRLKAITWLRRLIWGKYLQFGRTPNNQANR